MTRACIAALALAVSIAQDQLPTPTGVVSGRVTDEFGDPVIGALTIGEAQALTITLRVSSP